MKICIIVPIKHNSERVPGKNFRDFNGKPLFHIILNTLLKSKNIKYILDNDSTKWDKQLYGYDLVCSSPEIIKDELNVIVICNIGSYNYEVKKQLLEINNLITVI